ncbi:MAG: diaminopimelate decarboxylase [Bacteroidales bacterium]|nr:diaminopimelate decarboxylase [Bacteroidales bacterium]
MALAKKGRQLWRTLMETIDSINSLVTPCFILDQEELKQSICGFQEALKNNFANSVVGYSLKTNSLPYALGLVHELGAYAEVVSFDEYDLALYCGFMPDNIIYNGPMKSKETFLDAVLKGALVNIETKRELQWLSELPKNKNYKVGIRLNINISSVSPEDADGENDNSRFGFSDDTEEFSDALKVISTLPNVSLAGLHIHRTAHSRSLRFYQKSIDYACKTINKYGLTLDYLDVGGGYFGIFPNKPTYQQYSDAFHHVLSSYGLEKLCVIVEPGNALVASCFSFLSEVIDVKHVEEDCWFITTDGSRNDIDPFFRKTSYLQEVIYNKNNTTDVKSQVVSGCTCLEYDRLFSLYDRPLLSVGDRIYYRNVGAYTMCLSPMFIRYIPNVYLKKNDTFTLIRDKWSVNEYIQKSKLK